MPLRGGNLPEMWTISLDNVDATRSLGRRLGESAPPGAVVALRGELGAGKTALAKGVGAGLGVTAIVTSPTFILMAVYEGGRLPLYHADLYRLGDESELLELGLDEALEGDGLSLVEWPDRFPGVLPADHLEIHLRWTGEDTREATVRAHGPRAAALLGALSRA